VRRAAGAPAGGLVPARATATSTTDTPPPPALATRPVYRLLLMKGLTPDEASSLTAFMCGLPTSDLRWSLQQVNQLLFLRRMRQLGRFGDNDGRSKRPH